MQRPDAKFRRRLGATLVLMAALLPVLIMFVAFAMNLAYAELSRTELYISSDAATRAAGREFTLTKNQAIARTAGRDLATRNTVAGQPLQLSDTDFEFGESTRSGVSQRYNFVAGAPTKNSVQVTGRRTTGSLDGPISYLFPNVFSVSAFESQFSSISTVVEVDVAIVLDRSGSMAYGDTEPAVYPPVPAAAPLDWSFCDACPSDSRWLDAVSAVNAFLAELTNSPADERVALCTYNSSGTVDQLLTSNYSSIPSAMDTYTQSFCSGSTNIGGGIDTGVNAFSMGGARPWASKVIVILTDGLQTVTGVDIDAAAQNAADDGIMIFTVTFSAEAGQTVMQDVATIGYGQHFHAPTGADLILVFQAIAKSLPTLLTR